MEILPPSGRGTVIVFVLHQTIQKNIVYDCTTHLHGSIISICEQLNMADILVINQSTRRQAEFKPLDGIPGYTLTAQRTLRHNTFPDEKLPLSRLPGSAPPRNYQNMIGQEQGK
jgi:hypothetical protein